MKALNNWTRTGTGTLIDTVRANMSLLLSKWQWIKSYYILNLISLLGGLI